MKYFDEIILAEKRKAEELERLIESHMQNKKIEDDVKTGSTVIGEQKIEFERKELFRDLISIYIPKEFLHKEVSETYVMFQSSNIDRNVILTMVPGSVNSLTIEDYKKQMEEKMRQEMQIGMKWIEEGFVFIDSQKVTYVAFTTPIETDVSYNFIFFTKINDNTLICNFNCTGMIVEDWKWIGKGIMNSLRIHID